MMLSTIRTKATMMASPGTGSPGSVDMILRMASIEWANVATKTPIASWLGRSRRMARTMRGENCPMASCTTTKTMVRTRPVRVTIDVATLPRIINAASGPPVTDCGTRLPSSSAIVTNEIATPTSTHNTGTSHRLVRRECATRKRFMIRSGAHNPARSTQHRGAQVLGAGSRCGSGPPVVDTAVLGLEAVLDTPEDGLGAAADAELSVGAANVRLDGVRAQIGQDADLAVALALSDEGQDLAFPLAEALRPPGPVLADGETALASAAG